MADRISKIELGVSSNRYGLKMFIFFIYRRTVISTYDDDTINTSISKGRWYRIRIDRVPYNEIGSYISKCKKGNVIDINDNIM